MVKGHSMLSKGVFSEDFLIFKVKAEIRVSRPVSMAQKALFSNLFCIFYAELLGSEANCNLKDNERIWYSLTCFN